MAASVITDLKVLKEYNLKIENASLCLLTMKKNASPKMSDASLRDILHTHTFAEIFVCRRGALTIESEFASVVLGEGDIAVVPADCRHTMRYQDFAVSRTEMGSLGVMLARQKRASNHDVYTPLYELLSLRGLTVYRKSPDLAHELYRLSLLQNSDASPKFLLHLPIALFELSERKGESVGDMSVKIGRAANESVDMARVALIEETINSHYLETLSADSLAETVHVSRRQLDRIIAARYGMSLHAILNEKRIRYAERLIKDTNRTLEEIRVDSCFPSASSFNRVFRDTYGVTPSEYRRKIKKY